jgi:4-amino-4-deoxy-L-arabinose transferase-like glycosyltransferase
VTNSRTSLRRAGIWLWILGLAFLYALHFVHLAADFPPRWTDASVLTDEGWYLNAATRHALGQPWYLPGDFNPAIVMPVWPAIAAVAFHVTGPGIVAARALALVLLAITLVCIALLVRRHAPLWVALLALSFVLASPFLFAFSRLALIEPLLLCLLAVAMLLADHISPVQSPARRWLLTACVGALLLLMLLTKLTALSLYPAVLYLLWHRLRASPRRVIASLVLVIAIVAVGYGLYRAAISATGFQSDFRYFFTSGDFGRPSTLKGWLINVKFAVTDLWWTSGWLAVLACVTVLTSLTAAMRVLWSDSLFVASLFLAVGTWAFVVVRAYHAPHYYLFTSVALAILVSLGVHAAFERTPPRYAASLVFVVAASLLFFVIRSVSLLRHPTYSFMNAAVSITSIVAHDPSSRPLLLAESGDQITLMTGQPSICDDFGATPLRDELRERDPGWFATFDAVNPETLAELHTRYHLQRVTVLPVSGDPGRAVLLFYRLVPPSQAETGVLLRSTTLKLYRRPPSSLPANP